MWSIRDPGRVALDLSRSQSAGSSTVLRGGFGTFLTVPWETSGSTFRTIHLFIPPLGYPLQNQTNFLKVPAVLKSLPPLVSSQSIATDFPSLTMVQPHLPDGYAEDLFLKLQHQFTNHFFVDTGLQGSLGRKLLAADVVNRQSEYNENLPAIRICRARETRTISLGPPQ
jgi:hypothetical protein